MAKHVLRHWTSECCGFHCIEMFDDEVKAILYYEIPVIEAKDRNIITPD